MKNRFPFTRIRRPSEGSNSWTSNDFVQAFRIPTGMIAILISAVLFSLSFPNTFSIYGYSPLAWIALVPLMVGLRNIDGRKRLRAGLLFGIVSYGLILQWLWPLHILGTMLFVLVLTVQPVIFICFYREIRQSFLNFLYVPSLWVVSEWLRTVILQGFCFSLGNSQAFFPPMIQSAAWGGVYAVAFVIVLVNGCVYSGFQAPQRRRLFWGMALAVVLINFFYGWAQIRHLPTKPLSISVVGVQANIEPHIKLDPDHFDANIQKHEDLTRNRRDGRETDLIVWPETAFPWDVRKDKLWYPQMQQLARDSGAVLVLGTAANENGRDFNSAFVMDTEGRPSGSYHKNHLIPFCEFCPSWLTRFPHLAGYDFLAGREQKVFPLNTELGISTDFGILICSESCYPKSARGLIKLGADFIIVILNDGWFKKPEAIMIHAQNAVLRAVETGRDVVSIGNTGGTFRVNRRGVIRPGELLELQKAKAGMFDVIPEKLQTTNYSRIGDIFAVVCLLFVIMILFFTNRKPFKD